MDRQSQGKLSIVGHGYSPNLGMRKGVVVHVDDVIEAINHAVNEAERISGIHIARATVNINGSHVSGLNSRGVIAVSSGDREISQDDRLRAEEAATIVQLPSNREIIQVFAQNYRLDGQENIKDPVGMRGVRLEVDTHIVTATTPSLRNLDIALEKAGVVPNNHTLSSLAAAEAVLNRQQKEAGTVLLDIGAGTTNMVVIEDGEVQHVAVLPIGGINLTNDLAIGLKTDLDIAEVVKVRHATLLPKVGTRDIRIKMKDQEHVFKAEDIAMITEARIDELFDYVQKELAKIHRAHKLPGGAVIVGGTSKLPGISEFAKEKMQIAARVGKLQDISGLIDTVNDPEYCAAVGLMMLDMLLVPEVVQGNGGGAHARAINFVDNLLARFRK
jgi:cell division protein FtsA